MPVNVISVPLSFEWFIRFLVVVVVFINYYSFFPCAECSSMSRELIRGHIGIQNWAPKKAAATHQTTAISIQCSLENRVKTLCMHHPFSNEWFRWLLWNASGTQKICNIFKCPYMPLDAFHVHRSYGTALLHIDHIITVMQIIYSINIQVCRNWIHFKHTHTQTPQCNIFQH